MQEEEALLRAIVNDPDDDLRRLVYADWLEERDDPASIARGRFIRLQCEREKQSPYSAMTPEEMELLRWEHQWAWYLPSWLVTGCKYRRGFPEYVECSAESLVTAWEAGLILVPVESLTMNIGFISPAWQDLKPPSVRFPLKDLTLRSEWPTGAELIYQLSRFGPYPRLQSLAIHDPNFWLGSLDYLTQGSDFPMLEQLDLLGCNIGDEGAEQFATSLWTTRLKLLVLSENGISQGRIEWLRTVYGDALVI